MKFTLKKVIEQGEMRPPFYGRAYMTDFSGEMVCYPIPLNWIVGWWREICWYLQRGPWGYKNKELKALLRKEYERGYIDGQSDTSATFKAAIKRRVGW